MVPNQDQLGGEPDAGGCYHEVADPVDSSLAWTQDVGEDEILTVVVWGACEVCEFHMGDEQWEDIEIEMNSAFDENHTSDNEYMPSIISVDGGMPSIGKENTCMGECGGRFWSASGTSTHCLDCRD
jgi:hypothetical protein